MPKGATKKGKKQPRHLFGKGVSVYFQEGQNRWMCSVKLDNGKRKYISGSVGAEFEQCEEKFRMAIEEVKRGARVNPDNQTIKEYIVSWLEERKIKLKRGTYPKWKNFIEAHVIPDLGSYQLQKFRREHAQVWISGLIKKGLAASSIHIYHRILKAALKDAVKRKIISENPCEDTILPRVEEKEMRFFDPKQTRHLLASIEGHPYEALIALAVTTGMRRGELQALRWEDIHLEEGILNVRRTVVYVPREGYYENEPKTRGSRRIIPLTPEMIQILHRAFAQSEEKTGLVFRGRGGGHFSSKGIGYAWDRILEGAELPKIRFHDLRHTAATLLLRAGASLKSVQKILGHANIATTMKYIHLLPEMLEEDIKRLSALLAA